MKMVKVYLQQELTGLIRGQSGRQVAGLVLRAWTESAACRAVITQTRTANPVYPERDTQVEKPAAFDLARLYALQEHHAAYSDRTHTWIAQRACDAVADDDDARAEFWRWYRVAVKKEDPQGLDVIVGLPWRKPTRLDPRLQAKLDAERAVK